MEKSKAKSNNKQDLGVGKEVMKFYSKYEKRTSNLPSSELR